MSNCFVKSKFVARYDFSLRARMCVEILGQFQSVFTEHVCLNQLCAISLIFVYNCPKVANPVFDRLHPLNLFKYRTTIIIASCTKLGNSN